MKYLTKLLSLMGAGVYRTNEKVIRIELLRAQSKRLVVYHLADGHPRGFGFFYITTSYFNDPGKLPTENRFFRLSLLFLGWELAFERTYLKEL